MGNGTYLESGLNMFLGHPVEFWLAMREKADVANTTPLFEEIGRLHQRVKELEYTLAHVRRIVAEDKP